MEEGQFAKHRMAEAAMIAKDNIKTSLRLAGKLISYFFSYYAGNFM